MAASDPVDATAMIFTEADVYAIGGYLAHRWGVARDSVTLREAITEDIERAITAVLASVAQAS